MPTWFQLGDETHQDPAKNRPGGDQNRGKTVLGTEEGSKIGLGLIVNEFWNILLATWVHYWLSWLLFTLAALGSVWALERSGGILGRLAADFSASWAVLVLS